MAGHDRPSKRLYYSIGEVCDMLGLEPHVLRYWESSFRNLRPAKNRSGNRVYREKDLRIIRLIQYLVHEEGYTIEGADRKLQRLLQASHAGNQTELPFAAPTAEGLLREVRAGLLEIQSLLSATHPPEEPVAAPQGNPPSPAPSPDSIE